MSENMPQKNIWVVYASDPRVTALRKEVAEAIPNSTIKMVSDLELEIAHAPWPDMVVGGLECLKKGREIKKGNPAVKMVSVAHPVMEYDDYAMAISPRHLQYLDALIVPEPMIHPDTIFRGGLENKVLVTPLLPMPKPLHNAVSEDEWNHELHGLANKHPVISVLVGGDADPNRRFTAAHTVELTEAIDSFLEHWQGSLYVTNSKRTNPDTTRILRHNLPPNRVKFHDVNDILAKNPFPGMMQHSDAFIVTADSLAMCMEAVSTGKPVYIYEPKGSLPPHYKRFVDKLYELGYAKPIEALQREGFVPWQYDPSQLSKNLATQIEQFFATPAAEVSR